MIITCPHCQTRYQVAFDAIGSAGRKVQCAHCNRAWQQGRAEPEALEPEDKLFDAMAEEGLDKELAAEEARASSETAEKVTKAEPGPRASAAVDRALALKQERAFKRRQNTMFANLPLGRVRRMARYVGVATLVAMLGGAYFGRTMIVTQYPAMAGVYEAVGLGVNVVGLDFANVDTLQILRDGKDVLVVSAEIVGLNAAPVRVPPVVVTLLDSHGEGIYEWSVTPNVPDLMAGERVAMETQLALPPGEASRVRLSFTGGGVKSGGAEPRVAAASGVATEVPHTAAVEHAGPAAAPSGVGH